MRRRPLIALIAGLALALALVLVNLATGTVGGSGSEAAPEDGAPTGEAAPATGEEPAVADEEEDEDEPEDPQPTEEVAEYAEHPDGSVRYAARTDESETVIAIVVWDDWAVAYLCDGLAFETWLTGVVVEEEEDILLTDRDETIQLEGWYEDGALQGVVSNDGKHVWTFTAPVVEEPAGLYLALSDQGPEVRAGWVVLPDESQTGVAQVDGRPFPAPGFDVEDGTLTVDGTEIPILPLEYHDF
ncbi:hypothetical protein PJ985_05935 [Streptomyces sp. ACA25]|uniref:hypothetical protein n=1 Tax=Streptomyces sp. ACA25 TaxID=3022596 RepID=UPI002307C7CA|nr:hypothetical protein [Streptomyces sp. ACA25]MDB1087106.1 hypothetical protein [Streptomyces sp. ACA25]